MWIVGDTAMLRTPLTLIKIDIPLPTFYLEEVDSYLMMLKASTLQADSGGFPTSIFTDKATL